MRSVFEAIKMFTGLRPQSISGSSAVNGLAVDTFGFNSGVVTVGVGAATGTPTSYTVAGKVQESADGSTNWADVPNTLPNQLFTIAADNTSAQIQIEGLGTSRKRYLRVVVTPAFTGGTSPTVPITSVFGLGRAFKKPVSNSTTPA